MASLAHSGLPIFPNKTPSDSILGKASETHVDSDLVKLGISTALEIDYRWQQLPHLGVGLPGSVSNCSLVHAGSCIVERVMKT